MSDQFLPNEYEVPSTESKYMKLEKGENTFRVMSSAIIGWELWTSEIIDGKEVKKPVRYKTTDTIPTSMIDPNAMPKHFWAFVVYNFQDDKIQILELTQRSVQKAIKAYTIKKAWGDPRGYDITITKTGDGMETRYEVTVNPPSPIDEVLVKKVEEMNINLEALYEGGDPFAQ